jgi:drug/metabolite transporter (DMT)-like permease
VDANTRAIGLVLLSMVGFAVSDMFIKLGARTMPVAELILAMGAGGAVIFAALAVRAGDPLWSPAFLHPVVLLRNTAEIIAAFGMVGALALAPLSLVSAITQATPLLVTIGAALVLKETVGPRRWIAIFVGLGGVLLILRPDGGGPAAGALLALLAAVALATRDLSTRGVPASTSNLQLATYGFGATGVAGAVALLLSGGAVMPDAAGAGMLLGAIVSVALGYFAITAAMRSGEVSLVIPFRYTRLIFAGGLGIVVFGERPDAWTLTGAAIVIGSGLYVIWRERQLARSPLPNPAASR